MKIVQYSFVAVILRSSLQTILVKVQYMNQIVKYSFMAVIPKSSLQSIVVRAPYTNQIDLFNNLRRIIIDICYKCFY